MESGSNSTSCPMAFAGDNSDGPMCPMMMMMPPIMTSHQHHGHHHQHQQQEHDGYAYQSHHQQSSSLFLQSLAPPPQGTKNKVASSSSPSSCAPAYSLMEIHHNEIVAGGINPCSSSSSSASVKAKIMAHPHYHRLLAAYVNCQKVMREQTLKKIILWKLLLNSNDPYLILLHKEEEDSRNPNYQTLPFLSF